MAAKVKEGYAPAAFNVYPGAYAWHLNLLLPQQQGRLAVPDLATPAERDAWLKAHPMTVMAMPADDWNAWTNKPADAAVLLSSWMVHKPYVVVAVNAGAQTSDEAPPAENSAASGAESSAEEPAAAPAASAAPAAEPAAEKEAPKAPSATAPAEPEQTPAGSADSAARS